MVKRQKHQAVEFHSPVFPATGSKASQGAFILLVVMLVFFCRYIQLASVFVLSLCSEQPVNKEFSAAGSLEATAGVDITCLCDLPPAPEWTKPNTWAWGGRNALSLWGRRQEVSSSVYFFNHPQVSPLYPCSQYLGGPGVPRLSQTNVLVYLLLHLRPHGTAGESTWSKQRRQGDKWKSQ